MPRERLPDRRQAETLDLWHGGRRYHVTIGQYDDGRPGEVFLHGAKPGSDVDLLCLHRHHGGNPKSARSCWCRVHERRCARGAIATEPGLAFTAKP